MTTLGFENRLNGLSGRTRRRFFALFLALVLSLHLYGAYHNLHKVNKHMGQHDQTAYMKYARRLVESDYSYVGDGNRMPVYPLLQSLHYDADLSDREYFLQGVYLNMGLSVLLLLGLFCVFQHYFSNLVTVNLMLFTTFQLYMFRAGYFQAELLYYTLAFGTYVLMLRMFVRPSLPLALAIGMMAAVSHLTKASMLPGLAVFLAVFLLKTLSESWRSRREGLRYAIMWALVLVVFLGAFYPYARQLKRVFGQYFYNVNTSFYVWYDSWAEAEAGTKAHGDREGWPDMPPEEIPSWRKYLRETSIDKMVKRLFAGLKSLISRHVYPGSYGYAPYYITSFLVVVGLGSWSLWKQGRRFLRQVIPHQFLILFTVAYFSTYIVLYAFYAPINSGQRFAQTLLIPLMFALTMAMNIPQFGDQQRGLVSRINVILCPLLLMHGLFNAFYFVHVTYAGG